MAVTAIWDIRGRLGHVMDYAKNPAKTANPKWGQAELQALADVVSYAMDQAKTRGTISGLDISDMEESGAQRQYLVSGVNCDPATARDAMNMTKRRYCKEGGIVAYHAYQSFKPGEVTPELAHLIGLKLAEWLWGERFEAVVATHVNTGVIHNHFVINSVSCVDGKRYYDNKATYAALRRASDELCREHSLSVITQTNNRAKHYAEWQAENEGKPTWRSAIREDVDKAVAASMTWQAFLSRLRETGYDVKASGVKHVAVKPPGKERFVRLRSLGENYTEEVIRQRILKQRAPSRPTVSMSVSVRRVRVYGDFKLSKVTWKGLRALYFFYLYKLRQARRQNSSAPFAIREDLRHMEAISRQAVFLFKHGIDTAEQLAEYRAVCDGQITLLCAERRELKNALRRAGTAPDGQAVRISEITKQLKQLRKEARLCDDILARSIGIRENLKQAKKEKEEPTHEPNRGSGGANRKHGDQPNGQGR